MVQSLPYLVNIAAGIGQSLWRGMVKCLAICKVLTINEWLNAAEIGWGTSNGEAYGGLDTGFRFMRRHFTGSLDGCGRLNGGFWQAMGKESRLGSLTTVQ